MSYSGNNNSPMFTDRSRYVVTGYWGQEYSCWRVIDTAAALDADDDIGMGTAVEQVIVSSRDINAYWEMTRLACEWNEGTRHTSATLTEEQL